MEIVSIRVLCSISYKTNGTTLLENSQRVFSFHYQYSVFEKFSASTHPFPSEMCRDKNFVCGWSSFSSWWRSAALERYGRVKLLTNCSQMHAPQVFIHQSRRLLMKKATGVYKIPDSSVKVKTIFQPSPQGFQFNMQVIYFRRFWSCRRPILVFLEVLGKNFRPNLTRTQHL